MLFIFSVERKKFSINHTTTFEPLRRLSKPAWEGKVFCLKINTAKNQPDINF